MDNIASDERYIHPTDTRIAAFADEMRCGASSFPDIVKNIFRYFDENISYSRLDAPYFPLQRSDVDVLEMKSGTCGDFSNLLVSVFTYMGMAAQYAYISLDCYGDVQDHICAAVEYENRTVLIDATTPYRRFCGFDCPHREYVLYAPDDFLGMMKSQEKEWHDKAVDWGDERFAGILYAPWVLDVPLKDDGTTLDSVFFLLIADSASEYSVYINYLSYTAKSGTSPIMAVASNGDVRFSFSVNEPDGIWDEAQWSEAYLPAEVPERFRDSRFAAFCACIEQYLPKVCALFPSLPS